MLQSGLGDPGVCGGYGKVDNDLYGGIIQQGLGRAGFHALEFGGSGPRPFRDHVGTGDHVESVELAPRLEVNAADVAASDDARSEC